MWTLPHSSLGPAGRVGDRRRHQCQAHTLDRCCCLGPESLWQGEKGSEVPSGQGGLKGEARAESTPPPRPSPPCPLSPCLRTWQHQTREISKPKEGRGTGRPRPDVPSAQAQRVAGCTCALGLLEPLPLTASGSNPPLLPSPTPINGFQATATDSGLPPILAPGWTRPSPPPASWVCFLGSTPEPAHFPGVSRQCPALVMVSISGLGTLNTLNYFVKSSGSHKTIC